jgi:hypothetical protein
VGFSAVTLETIKKKDAGKKNGRYVILSYFFLRSKKENSQRRRIRKENIKIISVSFLRGDSLGFVCVCYIYIYNFNLMNS